MKKMYMILLSVVITLAAAGCDGTQGAAGSVAGELAGAGIPIEALETAFVLAMEEEAAEEEPEPDMEPEPETADLAPADDPGQEEGQSGGEGTSQESQTAAVAETKPADAPAQGTQSSGSSAGSEGAGAGNAPEESGGNTTAEPASVGYSPQEVISLATAKVKAGGKLILSEELDRKLSEGAITQEEYQEYYPYDGTGYYSVFVETDLNRASTTSGRLLGSVDGIAQYIADMLLLETVPSVEIEYAGVYTSNSGQFYEFRCHR